MGISDKRGSGILMHISSLPSVYGIGDLGQWAYNFADFLHNTKQSYWQVLPLSPTSLIGGNSPYNSPSAFAGNKLLISPELLVKDGYLTWDDVNKKPDFPWHYTDYSAVTEYKNNLFAIAYNNFKMVSLGENEDYELFCKNNELWLDDYAMYEVIKRYHNNIVWSQWRRGLRDRLKRHMAAVKKEFKDDIEKEKFIQYIFFKQWFMLKDYCNKKGIKIIGDIPIYVSYDSVDCWTNTDLFKLDDEKKPTHVSGVPPDYFSAEGQLWGNPVYNWDKLKETGFKWWIERMEHTLKLFDVVRIDHFRGLVQYWEIPAGETTAINGLWANVPTDEFFSALLLKFPSMNLIAEDLGIITQDVRDVLKKYGFPGMKVLLFAFCEENPHHLYQPHMYTENWVVYTGTHDNNTARGWFEAEAPVHDKWRLFRYIGRDFPNEEANWTFIRLAMMSVAKTAIIPMQDVIGLSGYARMNTPSTTQGNWTWRMMPDQLNPYVSNRLSELTYTYGRNA